MHEREKTSRAQDPVEKAGGDSFPASDPPAWTAARAGTPEAESGRQARRQADTAPPPQGEVVGYFRCGISARRAADALLAAGFNLVEIAPPRRHGGIGAHAARTARSLGLCAVLGAAAAATVAALLLPKGTRTVLTAAAGGAIGALSAGSAGPAMGPRAAGQAAPPNATWLRVKAGSPGDRPRALAILEAHGACMVHASWPDAF